MSRISYLLLSNGGLTGGQKMIIRHVETLCELGFDATCMLGVGSRPPSGIDHSAPIIGPRGLSEDDIVVICDDAVDALRLSAGRAERVVVFSQGGYSLAALGADALDTHPAARFPVFITVGEITAARIRRMYPQAQVEVVPCFADERIFKPGDGRRLVVAHTPRKRPFEALAIKSLFRRIHKRHAEIGWIALAGAGEVDVARAFATSALYLGLNRLESVGMSTLEAMASGSVCAGFLGGGGEQYGSDANGFWATDDDCEAAADALARAADMVISGGPALADMREAGRITAERWSYERFKLRLEETWMRLAPDARLRRAPVSPDVLDLDQG